MGTSEETNGRQGFERRPHSEPHHRPRVASGQSPGLPEAPSPRPPPHRDGLAGPPAPPRRREQDTSAPPARAVQPAGASTPPGPGWHALLRQVTHAFRTHATALYSDGVGPGPAGRRFMATAWTAVRGCLCATGFFAASSEKPRGQGAGSPGKWPQQLDLDPCSPLSAALGVSVASPWGL